MQVFCIFDDRKFVLKKNIHDSPCKIDPGEQPSSLIIKGRGGLPESASDDIFLSALLEKPNSWQRSATNKSKPTAIDDRLGCNDMTQLENDHFGRIFFTNRQR